MNYEMKNMDRSEPNNDIHTIIDLSDKMLQKARQQDWEDVTSIENQRKQLISGFFSKPVHIRNGKIADCIRAILEKDREIVKLGAARRKELRGALHRVNRGKEAVTAYKTAV